MGYVSYRNPAKKYRKPSSHLLSSLPKAVPPPPPAREMKGPAVNIDDLLKSVNAGMETKKVSTTPKKGGSTGKNSVTIKL